MIAVAATVAWSVIAPLSIAGAVPAPGEVHTDTAEAHACADAGDGATLAATSGGLVLARGDARAVWTALDGLPDTRVFDIEPAGDGTWWLATEGGVARVAVAGGSLDVVETIATAEPAHAIARAGDTVYAGLFGGGVARVSGGRARAIAGTEGAQVTALATRGGGVVAGTVRRGLIAVDARGARAIAGTEELVAVTALRRAGDAIRVASLAGSYTLRGDELAPAGDARDERACTAAAAGGGLPSNDLSAAVWDGHRLWIGAFDRGVAYYEAGGWHRLDHPAIDRHVNALAVADGALWIATSAGLSVVRGDAITRLGERDGLPSRHVLSLAPRAGGGVLVGTTRGAAIVDGGVPTVLGRKGGARLSNVWAVAEDAGGDLWLGTTKGLYRYRPDAADGDDAWERFSVATGHLQDDWVMALATRGGHVYAGTYKAGVARLSAEGDEIAATQLGGGWINPGGLRLAGDSLLAATMDGPMSRSIHAGDAATWQPRAGAPGTDTTAVVPTPRGLVVTSRRGLAVRSQRPPP